MPPFLRCRWLFLFLALTLAGRLARADDKVAPDRAHIYTLAEVDRPPKPKGVWRAVYPEELKAQGLEGTVVIDCVVDLNGILRDPVVKSSTNKAFELAALQTVAKCKYRPARKNGKDVNVRMEFPITFKIH